MAEIRSEIFNSPRGPIHYLHTGPTDGPLLIFLHGWPEGAWMWKHQIKYLGSLGYWCVAPDMAGYGKSLAPKGNWADYALEEISKDNLALLSHLGRNEAVWIGHDWGAGATSALIAHHPDVAKAACIMSVPYRTLELGLVELLKVIDHNIYPIEEFPHGQLGYQANYERRGVEEVELLDRNKNGIKLLAIMFAPANPANIGKPFLLTANEKGFLNGEDLPDIPTDKDKWGMLDQDVFDSLVEGVERNGWFGPTAWYMNHARNREYSQNNLPTAGELTMPVLYINGEFDPVAARSVCNDTYEEPMRRLCKDLTYIDVPASHWVAQNAPDDVNKGIEAWLKAKHIVSRANSAKLC